MTFEFKKLEIPDVILIAPKVFEDERGFFMETYKKEDFDEKAGIKGELIQDNHSELESGVLRGLHFQREPYAQAKIVRCIRGAIYDVAVDLRMNSPTFGNYVGINLSEDNMYQLYIPGECAHGFLVLSDIADVIYKVDNIYALEYEGGLIWNDPDVNVNWPNDKPILSQKDQQLPRLRVLVERGEVYYNNVFI